MPAQISLSASGSGVSSILAQMSTWAFVALKWGVWNRGTEAAHHLSSTSLSQILYSSIAACFPFNLWCCSSYLLNTLHLCITLNAILVLQSSCSTSFLSLKINFPGHLNKTLLTSTALFIYLFIFTKVKSSSKYKKINQNVNKYTFSKCQFLALNVWY